MTFRRLLTLISPSIGAVMIGRGAAGIATTGNTLAYSLLITAGVILFALGVLATARWLWFYDN